MPFLDLHEGILGEFAERAGVLDVAELKEFAGGVSLLFMDQTIYRGERRADPSRNGFDCYRQRLVRAKQRLDPAWREEENAKQRARNGARRDDYNAKQRARRAAAKVGGAHAVL